MVEAPKFHGSGAAAAEGAVADRTGDHESTRGRAPTLYT
jgi:hypothetical protein